MITQPGDRCHAAPHRAASVVCPPSDGRTVDLPRVPKAQLRAALDEFLYDPEATVIMRRPKPQPAPRVTLFSYYLDVLRTHRAWRARTYAGGSR